MLTLGPAGRSSIADRAPAALAGADPRTTGDVRPGGSSFSLPTWWTSAGELQYVELTPDGPVLPVVTLAAHGNAVPPQGRDASRLCCRPYRPNIPDSNAEILPITAEAATVRGDASHSLPGPERPL